MNKIKFNIYFTDGTTFTTKMNSEDTNLTEHLLKIKDLSNRIYGFPMATIKYYEAIPISD